MRKKIKYKEVGDKRIKTRFLIFPKIIDNELRWWETVSWEETVQKVYTFGNQDFTFKWIPTKWLD